MSQMIIKEIPLGVYTVRTFRQEKSIYHSEMRSCQNSVYMLYKEDESAPNPLETLLSALSACKLVNFWDLAEKYKIVFANAEIEITAVVSPDGVVEGTHQPKTTVKSIHTIWCIQSDMTTEEIDQYLNVVDGACTVGNSLNPAIEFSHEIRRV